VPRGLRVEPGAKSMLSKYLRQLYVRFFQPRIRTELGRQRAWHVPHSHSKGKNIVRDLAERRAAPGDGMLEAGCYMGGSTAKFIVCKLLGYKLRVYGSFQGVEPMTEEQEQLSHDFSGEYAATKEVITRNVACFGEPDVCTFVKD
jgi:hypothetical protein